VPCRIGFNISLKLEKMMNKELDYMLERYPEYRGRIIELFGSDEDFKSLCDDIWQCKNNLVKFRENRVSDTRNENEYRLLLLDLEQEVLNFLARH
jgi:hypothetical protein